MIFPSIQFPLNILLLNRFPLVVTVLALCQGNGELGKTFFIDEKEDWNYRKPLFFGFGLKFFQLAGIQQELAVPFRIVVVMRSQAVFGDVQVPDKEFIAGKRAKRVHKAGFPFTDGFDLGPGKYHTAYKLVRDKILKVSFTVLYFNCVVQLFLKLF